MAVADTIVSTAIDTSNSITEKPPCAGELIRRTGIAL